MNYYDLIKRPLNTEKTTIQKEIYNQVTLEVDDVANRVDIKKAVESIFKVKVAGVRTMRVNGKIKRRGRTIGKRRNWKKAIITLMPGERIDFFDGV
ncbi:MAG: 50S ribosomal protein L23 [Desulfobacterales bacterium]|jgi:large subunit ribosomal protein L23|nr:50S ribosomal protein L23 [Desulfobacteraceae bacterium]MBT4364272.1 50S ribosomal protein L23 [Desulfobacteraceae bacterium]MBT7086351.1 50S ribosomal protein L23 [Desulfobacterales bacterium]MBT7696284.1 50S ribosomal protein L23 [Desulfobacterales bacterium]